MRSTAELEDLLAAPSPEDVESLARLGGDLLILGAGGKMGPTLAVRAKRALVAAGVKSQVIAASRFSSPEIPAQLEAAGVRVAIADLLDPEQVRRLPEAPNVLFMAGRKFGSTGAESLTWAMNAYTPALVAERFRQSRIVAFSSGNVYPLMPVTRGGATEETPAAPVGEYAQSVLARERIFQHFSSTSQTPVTLLRLNYAVDLRYGVLLDIGSAVFERRPVDVRMGLVNVIWQGDANSVALRCFERCCTAPATILNLTGPETLSVRWIAQRFGEQFGVDPQFEGEEGPAALLNNAARCHRLFGYPKVSVEQMIEWTAQWIGRGGETHNKPTHFEVRDGRY